MRLRSLVLTALAVATTSGLHAEPLWGQDVPTVAVMDFTGLMVGAGGESGVNLGKAVTAMLVTEFSERDGIQIVERAEIQDMLREQDLALSGRLDEASAVEIGRLLGVQYVLHGQITSIMENLRMDIRAVDVETSEIVAVMKKTNQTSELLAVVVDLADEFGSQLNLAPPSQRPQIEPIPVRATIEFSRGLDFEDRGEVEQAIARYEAALAIHPNHRDARRALERLRGGAQ